MKLYFVNHDSEVFDATEATSSVKWSGKNESASRSVTVTMLNDRTRMLILSYRLKKAGIAYCMMKKKFSRVS